MLSVRVLGPVDARRGEQVLTVPAGKTRELLVRLAMDAGSTVSAERLIDDLWGPGSATTNRNTLQSKVARLRRALGDDIVVGGRTGYALPDAVAVDAIEVTRLAAEARALVASDAAAAARVSGDGLRLFRGDVLADAGDGAWVAPHRTRLEETRLDLLETNLRARLAIGDAGVIGEAEQAVSEHPLREGVWAVLITALYQAHRQADALAAFARVRSLLADELGLDPSPELQDLERRVLRHDEALAAAVATPPAPAAAGNLPALTARLVGRAEDLAQVVDRVRDQRLVTVVGPAGVGKTRLAVEVGGTAHPADGVWLARLEHARTEAAAVQAIGDCFGMLGATPVMLADRLRTADVLLVVDNCEHLLDTVAELVAQLLAAAPRLRVLATSQMPLALDGESVYHLEPLGRDDSVALFALRAAERRRSFALDDDTAAAVTGLCDALDGLPLAIELAAARTRVLTVQEIARRLDDRFRILSDTGGRRSERHRALSTAIGWSHDLLFPDERRALWALCCFADGAPLDAAESVATALGVPADATLDLFERLVERSLVALDATAAEARYRLLDSVRAFAHERLAEAGLADTAAAAHVAWLRAAAAAALREQHGPRQPVHQAFLRRELANIEAGISWALAHDTAAGLEIALGFGWTSVTAGEGAVGARRLRQAVDAAAPDEVAPRVAAAAMVAWSETGADVRLARAAGEHAVALAATTDDPGLRAQAAFGLSFALIHSGEPAEALGHLSGLGGLPLGPWDRAMAGVLTGYAAVMTGDTERARRGCDEAAHHLAATEADGWMASHVEGIRGQLAQAGGDLAAARAHLTAAVDAAEGAGMTAAAGFHLAHLGRVLQLSGALDEAAAVLRRAVEITTRVGLMRVVALAQVRLGRVQRDVGDIEASRASLAAACAWFRASGHGEEALLAECLLACLDGDRDQLEASLGAADAASDAEVAVLARDGLAAAAARNGDRAGAMRWLGEADALMPAAAHRLAPSDRIDARGAQALLAG